MTTTANPLLENCCSPCCGDGGCNNKGTINIQSTNPDCLRVDTSECGVVKLEPTCPKPTYVKAGDNVTIKEVNPPSDCYMDGGDCGIKGGREVSSTDEKVKACDGDTTPGYLDEKLEAGHAITITNIGCDGSTNSRLRISVNENKLSDPDFPEIKVNNLSNLVTLSVGTDADHPGHVLTIRDNEESTYNNMCCIGFEADQNFHVEIDNHGNSDTPLFMGEDGHNWTIFTGNRAMATKQGLKILEDGYYRLFGQITVQNNIDDDVERFYFNLGRGLLKIKGNRTALNDNMYLSTAKHGAYGRQVLLVAGNGIDISDKGKISTGSGEGQTDDGFDGPWMTFNIDCLVDLEKDDIVTIGYRPQSDNKSNPDYDQDDPSAPKVIGSFRFVGKDDSSTDYNALFGGTVLGVYQLAPKRFQKNKNNEVYETI